MVMGWIRHAAVIVRALPVVCRRYGLLRTAQLAGHELAFDLWHRTDTTLESGRGDGPRRETAGVTRSGVAQRNISVAAQRRHGCRFELRH